jgi:uncharacterized protein (TIGR03437 family)
LLLLLCALLAGAALLHAQTVTITLGATAASGASGCSLTDGQVCTLTSRVTCTGSGTQCAGFNPAVTWSFSPSQVGTFIATPPDATGLSTATYTAPNPVVSRQTVTATAAAVANTTKTASTSITLNVNLEVGSGAPTGLLQTLFVRAYGRDGFYTLVALPPLGPVKALGSSGYVQEFTDAAGNGTRYALATISPTSPSAAATPVVQLLPPLYAYYTTIGANTAGYPMSDTRPCPTFDTANSCLYDTFDKGVALFAYVNPIANGQNFSITGAFYTEWTALGGLNGPGRPVQAQTSITGAPIAPSTTGNTATVEYFSSGAIYSISSGANRGKTFGVIEPVYDLYVNQSGPSGGLGLPTADAIQISSSGLFQQTFEGGVVQYSATSDPTILLPVGQVTISGAAAGSTTNLTLGQSLTLTANPSTASGTPLAGRPVSWVTSNSKVISIQPNGPAAVITAVGAGVATVQAVSQGISSAKINFIVTAPCCQVGDGAPSTVQQAFQDALTRNRIAVQLPVPSPAVRVGSGYVQTVQSSDAPPVTVLLTQSDQLGAAYVVTGALLARYQAMGGPSGPLGYPSGDAGAGGTQLFSGGNALAGNPVRLVSGGVLSKWAQLGYEGGSAGLPLAEAAAFTTPGANSGQQQTFAKGVIYAATAGPRSGQAYFVSGLILARYAALGDAAGDLGMPASDEFASGTLRQQNFEGGNITYTPGDAAAVEHLAPRTPHIVVSPATVSAGARLRLAAAGFANQATLRVSVSGQPDFLVTTANGTYTWDMSIPLAAKSGTMTIRAVADKGTDAASGSVTIKGFADNRLPIAKVQGDNQTGPPGALLPVSLRIALADAAGTPVAGAAVAFQASAGAQLSATNVVTDAAGRAETFVRLPTAEGVVLVTANAPGVAQVPVTFSAIAQKTSLSNFPAVVQTGDTSALLASAAAILRYHQNRGELRAPNGLADPAALAAFLKGDCRVDLKGAQVCDGFLSNGSSGQQIVNLWRAADFTGGVDVRAVSPSIAAIADLAATGSPVLLSLALARNGSAAGGHFVVATGVAADGSIVIQDPNPLFARTSLKDYVAGFQAAGSTWSGELKGVVQFVLRSPGATRFLLGALSQPGTVMQGLALEAQSVDGVCGVPWEIEDAVDAAGNSPAGGILVSRLVACDGLQAVYQLKVGTAQSFHAFVSDLASAGSMVDLSGSAPAVYSATRPQLNLVVAPQTIDFRADGVVNAATFTSGIAPGGIVAIFGSGLWAAGGTTTIDVDGAAAQVVPASPFQVNAVLPADVAPGTHTLRVRSPFGAAQQDVAIVAYAPAIFLMGDPSVGALVNPDGSLNAPSRPVARGDVLLVFATGLGAVQAAGSLSVVSTPVSVVVNGQELQPDFAGLAPGFPGLYQINVRIPATTPPGLGLPLTLKQGQQASNSVPVSIQ